MLTRGGDERKYARTMYSCNIVGTCMNTHDLMVCGRRKWRPGVRFFPEVPNISRFGAVGSRKFAAQNFSPLYLKEIKMTFD